MSLPPRNMRANRLQDALKHLGEALREAEEALAEARAEHDPLASHILVSRRQYRNISYTKSGKRSETAARMSWQTACELCFGAAWGSGRRMGRRRAGNDSRDQIALELRFLFGVVVRFQSMACANRENKPRPEKTSGLGLLGGVRPV